MAGNIIPAIAATNAIVAGLIVMTAFNVLREEYHKCQTVRSTPHMSLSLILNTNSANARLFIFWYLVAAVREQSSEYTEAVVYY